MQKNSAVVVENLSVQFGDFFAVNNISFEVNKGEIFGFLGANGAGKTTTIRVLCGLLVPTQGKAWVAGSDVYTEEKQIKSKVGYMSQKFTLYNDLSVEENLNFIADLRKLERRVYLRQREALFDFIGFKKPVTTLVRELPPGTKQHVSLAAALLHDPDIIFLDEPTAGVSPASREVFWALIRKLAAQHKTVFVTTHYMDEAEQCQRIALMRDGQIILLDSPDGLKETVFPKPIYEFEPLVKIDFRDMKALSLDPVFSFFEPYGLRFHAAPRDEAEWALQKQRFETRFHIKPIKASLEDVFIRSVEAKKT